VLAATPEARTALLARAEELARERGAQHIELRQGAPCDLGWQDTAAKVAMVVPLPQTVEEYWQGLSGRLRNKIRNARKNGFEVHWGGGELVGAFYSVFAANMRNLGTPVYPRAWFENVCRFLPEETRILTLWDKGKPVAGTLMTTFRDFVELPWIASLPEERRRYSTVLLYGTALEWAIQNGYARVDLGRCTPGSGTHQFKQQWNCEEVPLHWYYWLAPGVPLPRLRPDNPKYRLAVKVWQKLPLWLANTLGPRIVRSIP
jgi:FemAB-related protein (PEP-CTERM system-associated)